MSWFLVKNYSTVNKFRHNDFVLKETVSEPKPLPGFKGFIKPLQQVPFFFKNLKVENIKTEQMQPINKTLWKNPVDRVIESPIKMSLQTPQHNLSQNEMVTYFMEMESKEGKVMGGITIVVTG